MELLKNKINECAKVLPGDMLKVDGFLNYQIDVGFVAKLGREWYERFKKCGVTKILTIESAGIGIACLTAQYFDVPVVYAKKNKTLPHPDEVYATKVVSYTHGQVYEISVLKEHISSNDKILLIDDFVSNGSALKVLIQLAEMGGAEVVGAGVAIEKTYSKGGNDIRSMGYRLESLVKIAAMDPENGVTFAE